MSAFYTEIALYRRKQRPFSTPPWFFYTEQNNGGITTHSASVTFIQTIEACGLTLNVQNYK